MAQYAAANYTEIDYGFYIPAGMQPPERSIIDLPELAIYYENFGNGLADNCLVAEMDGKVAGAVWTRIMNDYGHVDDETPSFALHFFGGEALF